MTLSFVRSLSKPERDVSRRTQDDIYLRGPILLANRHFNPLTDYIPSKITIKTWKLAKSCADDLVDGRRFENAIWRLWGQQQFNLKRVSNAEVDWETILGWSAGGKAASLLVPLVVSKDTCQARHELPFVSAFYGLLPAPAPYWLPLPGSVPMRTRGIGEEPSIYVKSCVKSDTSSSRSHDSPLSFHNIHLPSTSALPQNARTYVVFNSYVQRSIIVDAYIAAKEDESGSETDAVSDLDPDEDETLFKRISHAFDSLSYNKDSGEATDEEPLPTSPTLVDSGTHKPIDVVLIQALPPIQLFPKVEDEERGVKIIFVPPKGQGALREEDILPAKEKPPPHPPTKLRRTISSHDLTAIIKKEEAEMNLGEMGGMQSHGGHNPGDNAPGGWFFLDGADGSSDEELLSPTVTSRRRLRDKRTKEAQARARFSLGDEEEDEEGGWEEVSADEEPRRAGDGTAPGISGRVTEPQIQAGIQGRLYGIKNTVEMSAKAAIYRGVEVCSKIIARVVTDVRIKDKGGATSTVGIALLPINQDIVQVCLKASGEGHVDMIKKGIKGTTEAGAENVVDGVVELGDAGVWVEQGHGEEGGKDQASQAAAAGPLVTIASWMKPAGGLRFWKK